MKKVSSILMLIVIIFLASSCKKETGGSNTNNPTGTYANYDFYVKESYSGFTKNFQKIAGYDNFYGGLNIIDGDIFSFGKKKYRSNSPIDTAYNYSGYVSKNNNEIYSNYGSGLSNVMGVEKVGADIYFNTCANGNNGMLSLQATCGESKTWKNGQLLDSLKGKYNNSDIRKQGQSRSYYIGVFTGGLVVKNGDVYVPGYSIDYDNGKNVSYGYWKNGVYKEILNINKSVFHGQSNQFYIADNNDIYYLIRDVNLLFKNGVEITNGKFDVYGTNINGFAVVNNEEYIFCRENINNKDQLSIYKNGVKLFTTNAEVNVYPITTAVINNKILFPNCENTSNSLLLKIYEFDPSTNKVNLINSNVAATSTYSSTNIGLFKVVSK